MPPPGYEHILRRDEIEAGRVVLDADDVPRAMKTLGTLRSENGFAVFRSDGRCLNRDAHFYARGERSTRNKVRRERLAFNCGRGAFASCVEGHRIWLRLRPDRNLEVQVSASARDEGLCLVCEEVLENPELEDYAPAVFNAIRELEHRLIVKVSADESAFGTMIIDAVFGIPTKKYKHLSECIQFEDPLMQQGIHRLCRGLYRFYRNPAAHGGGWSIDRLRARRVVGLVDFALVALRDAPTQRRSEQASESR